MNSTNGSDTFSKIIIDVSQKPKDLLLIEKVIQNTCKLLTSAINSKSQINSEYLHAKSQASNLKQQALEAINESDSIMTIQTLIEQTTYQKLVNTYKPQILEQTKRIELLEKNLTLLEEVRDIVQEFAKFESNDEKKLETYDLYDSVIDTELEELQAQLKNM